MHIFLRMCLALTPSDAVVESAFSKLGMILSDRRLSLSSEMTEQLLILALDSSPWLVYDYAPVAAALKSSKRRAVFRSARADRGQKRKAQYCSSDASSQGSSSPSDHSSSSMRAWITL